MRISVTILAMAISQLVFSQSIDPKKDVKETSLNPKGMAKAPRKVYINSFRVLYQMIDEASDTKKGGREVGGDAYKGDATARLAVGINGVETSALQNITDQFFTRFKNDLTKDGFTIMEADEIQSIEYFKDYTMVSGPKINNAQLEGYAMVSPTGFSYYVKGISKSGKEKKGVKLVDTGYKISRELDDIIVIDVKIVIPSIWLKDGVNLAGAAVKGGADLKLSKFSTITYQSGKDKIAPGPATSSITILKNDVPIEGVFTDAKFKSTANKSRVTTPEYANIFIVENTTVSITNTIDCEQAVYEKKVLEAILSYYSICYSNFIKRANGKK
ncbi:hypothetical protein KFE94_12800 [bacterium SCSIO 12643]|nr:hypothetical protein KFE94_12800 [bacterium SCSIO 12643]